MNNLPGLPESLDAATVCSHCRRPAGGVRAHPHARAGKVAAAHAVLLLLLQDVVVAEARLNHGQGTQATHVMEANEQLVVAALLSQADAMAARQALSEASRSSELDPLMQLPNRLLLRDRLTQSMADAKRRGSRPALLFLDLNDFMSINDTLGHAKGDEVLQKVAMRLCSAVREADTVSRHGGSNGGGNRFSLLRQRARQPRLARTRGTGDEDRIDTFRRLCLVCDGRHADDGAEDRMTCRRASYLPQTLGHGRAQGALSNADAHSHLEC